LAFDGILLGAFQLDEFQGQLLAADPVDELAGIT